MVTFSPTFGIFASAFILTLPHPFALPFEHALEHAFQPAWMMEWPKPRCSSTAKQPHATCHAPLLQFILNLLWCCANNGNNGSELSWQALHVKRILLCKAGQGIEQGKQLLLVHTCDDLNADLRKFGQHLLHIDHGHPLLEESSGILLHFIKHTIHPSSRVWSTRLDHIEFVIRENSKCFSSVGPFVALTTQIIVIPFLALVTRSGDWILPTTITNHTVMARPMSFAM
jgi:hypothetical protein